MIAPDPVNDSVPGRWPALGSLLILLAVACLPLLSLLGGGWGYLAHPDSELPVRLWSMLTFPEVGLLGGFVEVLGHPTPGVLNNPDVVGTGIVFLLRPVLGLAGAWNFMVVGLLFANMAATWAFLRAWLVDEVAAMMGALAVGLMPLGLSYSVASSISDMLNLWPYPLGLLALLRLSRGHQPVWNGIFAGLMAAAAVVSSPYAFVVAFGGVPVGALLAGRSLRGLARDPARRGGLLRGLGAMVLVSGLLVGLYALNLWQIMATPGSLVSVEAIGTTRNAPPWEGLRPDLPGAFATSLSDYLAVGKGALVQRAVGSHYLRTTSVTVTLALLTLLAALVSPRGRPWAGLALFAALASTGPFLGIRPNLFLEGAWNPFFFYMHYLTPGGHLLQETFRYGFLAAFAAAIAGAAAVAWLRARGGAWRRLAPLLPVLYVAEVLALSPVPIPLPVARFQVSPAYTRLDELLPEGAIIELPLSNGDTARFHRRHFLNQRVHGRAIADIVQGTIPQLMVENRLLRPLVVAEALVDPPEDGAPPKPETRFAGGRRPALDPAPWADPWQGRQDLIRQGFVGIVIDPSSYTSRAALVQVLELLGPGTLTVEDRLVHPLVALEPCEVEPGTHSRSGSPSSRRTCR